MDDIKIGNASVSIWVIVAMIGALLAFISLFMAIVNYSYTVGPVTTTTASISGLDFLGNKWDGHDVSGDFTFWRFMPLFAALLGLATLVLAALPIFGAGNSGTKTAFLVCAILTLVFGLLVFFVTASGSVLDGGTSWTAHKQIGAWFAFLGGLLAGVCAFLDFKGVKI